MAMRLIPDPTEEERGCYRLAAVVDGSRLDATISEVALCSSSGAARATTSPPSSRCTKPHSKTSSASCAPSDRGRQFACGRTMFGVARNRSRPGRIGGRRRGSDARPAAQIARSVTEP